MLYVLSYTLNPQRVPAGLFAELQKSPAWWHYLDTTWLIATHEDVNQLYERLRTHFFATDLLLLIEIRRDFQRQGWLLPDAWKWINETLGSWAR